jgi:hypothetical protein
MSHEDGEHTNYARFQSFLFLLLALQSLHLTLRFVGAIRCVPSGVPGVAL